MTIMPDNRGPSITIPAPDAATLQVHVARDLAALEADWRRIEAVADATLFQSWAWQKTWFDTVGRPAGDRPTIVVVSDAEGRPTGLIPLAVRWRRGHREARWLGEVFLDYAMPLLAPDLRDPRLWAGRGGLWSRVLKVLPADTVALVNMPAAIGAGTNPLCAATGALAAEVSWQCDLSGFDDLEHLLRTLRQPKTLSNERRKARKLRTLGDVRIVAPTTDAEAVPIIDALIAQKRKQLQARRQRSIFDDPNIRDFLLAFWKLREADAGADLKALMVDDRVAAVHWGAVYRRRFYYLQPSIDHDAFGYYSPGVDLLHALLEQCLDEDIPMFDFSLGDESYKHHYATQSTALHETRLACSVAGDLALGALGLARRTRQAVRRLRADAPPPAGAGRQA